MLCGSMNSLSAFLLLLLKNDYYVLRQTLAKRPLFQENLVGWHQKSKTLMKQEMIRVAVASAKPYANHAVMLYAITIQYATILYTAICKSFALRFGQITTPCSISPFNYYIRRMLFLTPNQRSVKALKAIKALLCFQTNKTKEAAND